MLLCLFIEIWTIGEYLWGHINTINSMPSSPRSHYIVVSSIRSIPHNSLRSGRNGRHFADDIFKCIFLNENVWILIKFSLKFVPRGSINNIPVLVQIMAWRRPGDKPLSEPMVVSLLTHICVTRPQWVNSAGTFVLNMGQLIIPAWISNYNSRWTRSLPWCLMPWVLIQYKDVVLPV